SLSETSCSRKACLKVFERNNQPQHCLQKAKYTEIALRILVERGWACRCRLGKGSRLSKIHHRLRRPVEQCTRGVEKLQATYSCVIDHGSRVHGIDGCRQGNKVDPPVI